VSTGLPTPHTGLVFFVPGIPAAQGSKRHVGGGVMIESSKRLRPWRSAVIDAADRVAKGVSFHGPVKVEVGFAFPRPRHHYGTGRNLDRIKDSAPDHHHVAPDIDKLVRAILDALVEAGILRDDSLVVDLHAEKRYGPRPGARVVIRHV
jgi:crossover junction endodeoxyribonuclease RusA